jgi:septum formation protein
VRRLILASASPARRFLLETSGLLPEVVVSHVDEDGTGHLPPREAVAELARRKARSVAARVAPTGALIVACDSLLEFDGEAWGKAASREEVVARWRRLRGQTGWLHTGHVLIDGASGTEVDETDTAVVHFGSPSDAEIDAYAETDESRLVAGPFTLEGRSAPWIDSIEGNYGTITGISLPVFRRLLARVDVEIVDLWN